MPSNLFGVVILATLLLAGTTASSYAQSTPLTVDRSTDAATGCKDKIVQAEKKVIRTEGKVIVIDKAGSRVIFDKAGGKTETAAKGGTTAAAKADVTSEAYPPSTREHFSAPGGGMSSGAHEGNESPTKKGNSANGRNESESAKQLTGC